MVFECKLVEWTFMPKGKRLRSSNWLKCKTDGAEYMFSETTTKNEAFFISKKTEDISEVVEIYCYDCVDRLKEFLNSGEDHTICNCSISGWESLYEFEILDNGDLRIGLSFLEEEKTIDIDNSILSSFKDFLNQHEWVMGNKEIIQNGLDIIREKIESCDLTVLDYIKLVSSEMEVGLFEQSITFDDYKEMNEKIFRLIEKFKISCKYIK